MAFCLLSLVGCRLRRAAPLAPYVALVANAGSHSIAVVDLASFQIVRSIPTDGEPSHLVLIPHSRSLCFSTSSGRFERVDFPQGRVKFSVSVGASAGDIALDAAHSLADVLDPADGEIVIVDLRDGSIRGRIRTATKLSRLVHAPGGNILLATAADGRLLFINLAKKQTVGEVKVGVHPGPLVVLPNGSQAFVADRGAPQVAAVDVPRREMLDRIVLGAPPSSLVLKPDGGEIFVLSQQAGTLSILDATHDDLEQTLSTGPSPMAAVFTPDSSLFFLATAANGGVATLRVRDRQFINATHVGIAPVALALTPDDRELAIADQTAGSLAILRTRSGQLVTTVPVGASPSQVVIPNWLWPSGLRR